VSDLVAFLRARLDEDEGILSVHNGRVMREVEAKRRIVRSYEITQRIVDSHDRLPSSPEAREQAVLVADAWRQAVEDLTLPYSDHPDYDEKWSPK